MKCKNTYFYRKSCRLAWLLSSSHVKSYSYWLKSNRNEIIITKKKWSYRFGKKTSVNLKFGCATRFRRFEKRKKNIISEAMQLYIRIRRVDFDVVSWKLVLSPTKMVKFKKYLFFFAMYITASRQIIPDFF